MKTKYTYSLIAALVMLLSINTFAQKSTAYFDTKTSLKQVSDKVVSYTFELDNITDATQKDAYLKKFQSYQGAMDVKVGESAANKQTYTITMDKQGNRKVMQGILINAGIDQISIDGVAVETIKALEYINGLERKAKAAAAEKK